MKTYFENMLSKEQRNNILQRPGGKQQAMEPLIKDLCLDLKQRGDEAIREYTRRFDNIDIRTLRVSEEEFTKARKSNVPEFAEALKIASNNIRTFHEHQRCSSSRISTMEGVTCWREARPIECVGLYVPARSAPLPSTLLMLGIPAKLAGCSKIIVCSPPTPNGLVSPLVLEAAALVGIDEIYKVGGAQAIAAMAYGTQTIPKVDKIFGPGNQYVTAAKKFVSTDFDGSAIDLLAGPSEVLIIADDTADPDVVMYDLISQAEHDPNAQSVLVTTSKALAAKVTESLTKRAEEFDRREIITASLKTGFILVTSSLQSAMKFSNDYAPEHLIINVSHAESMASLVTNAGSVFVGSFAPVTAGDYASGTNHTLPTNGTARWASGVSLESFQKNITFQTITESGLNRLAPTLKVFAETEGLPAHGRAVTSRFSRSQG